MSTLILSGKGDGVVVVMYGMRQRPCTPVSPQCRSCVSVEAGLEAQASSYWHSRPSAPEPDGLPELHSSTQAPFSRYIELVHREQDTPPVP